MKYFLGVATALLAFFVASPIAAQSTQPESREAAIAQLRAIAERLHPQTGDVRIPTASAVLHLGENYYFLPADEAQLVLTEGWGNPPDSTRGVLGMVFPAGRTFIDDTWGAVITYEASGYVSDSDAESTDYGELIEQLRGGEDELNQRRAQAGYPAQHLVGWAQTPAYDRRSHSVVWAQNIQFAGSPENSLNFDIRILGRRGVLSLNMVTVMSKLDETREAARRFAASAEFEQGARYADFQPGTDRVAEYGVAGLIAAGVGATIAKKAGLLAIILAFGKKAIVFILIGLGLLWGRIKRLFGLGDEEEEVGVYYEPAVYDGASSAEAAPAADDAAAEPPSRPNG